MRESFTIFWLEKKEIWVSQPSLETEFKLRIDELTFPDEDDDINEQVADLKRAAEKAKTDTPGTKGKTKSAAGDKKSAEKAKGAENETQKTNQVEVSTSFVGKDKAGGKDGKGKDKGAKKEVNASHTRKRSHKRVVGEVRVLDSDLFLTE